MREMKDSGIEWVGLTPSMWANRRIKYVIKSRDSGLWGQDVKCEENGTICLRIADFDYSKGIFKDTPVDALTYRKNPSYVVDKCHLKKGDILIEKSGGGEKTPVGRTVLFDKPYIALFANFMDRIRVNTSVVMPQYLQYWFRAFYSCKMSPYYINQTTGIQNINLSRLLTKEKVFYPSLKDQKAIVSFLDIKCSEIDAISADIQKEIETLEQYKRSVITEAVTKGLNPDVEMKDSGVAWCPQIPSNWQYTNPKGLFGLRTDRAFRNDRQLTASQEYGIVYQDEYMEKTGNKVVTVTKDFSILKHVEPDDFVISMRSFQGGLEYSDKRGCISSAYVMLIPNKEFVYAPFYRWFFKSSKYINALQSTSNLVRDGQAMRYANFVKVPLFIVPIEEQKAIASYLDEKIEKVNSILAAKKKQIEILSNYKKSLIYEYVTGKKEAT